MARINIRSNIKFRRLCRRLRPLPAIYVQAHLEAVWATADTQQCPVFESADDIEIAAEWDVEDNEPGAFAEAVIQERFFDETADGRLYIHDYFAHRAEWVIKNFSRRYCLTFAEVTALKMTQYLELEKKLEAGELRGTDSRTATKNNRTADNGCRTATKRQPKTADRLPEKGREEKGREEKDRDQPIADRPKERARSKPAAKPRPAPPTPSAIGEDSADLHPAGSKPPKARGGPDPGAAGDILGNLRDFLPGPDALVDDIRQVGSLPATWNEWLRVVTTRLHASGSELSELWENLQHARDCQDAVARQAKGLGPLKDPRGYVVKALTEACKRARVRWPEFPD